MAEVYCKQSVVSFNILNLTVSSFITYLKKKKTFLKNHHLYKLAKDTACDYCQFRFLMNFSAPYMGNLWLVRLGILHCSLWPVQTINFQGTGAKGSEIDSTRGRASGIWSPSSYLFLVEPPYLWTPKRFCYSLFKGSKYVWYWKWSSVSFKKMEPPPPPNIFLRH